MTTIVNNVWQLAAACSPDNWLIIQQQATDVGWTIGEDGDIAHTLFNPLTDSDVVCEIHYYEGSVWTELRDHDGEGGMIPHTAVVDYHTDHDDGSREYFTSFVFNEMQVAFLAYCHHQTRKYESALASQLGWIKMSKWLKTI